MHAESTCIPYKTPEHTSQTQVTMYNVNCIHFILQGELLLHRFFYGAYHLDNKLTIVITIIIIIIDKNHILQRISYGPPRIYSCSVEPFH